MVMDDKALPLTRAWCLFEVLQTLTRSSNERQFEGAEINLIDGRLTRPPAVHALGCVARGPRRH